MRLRVPIDVDDEAEIRFARCEKVEVGVMGEAGTEWCRERANSNSWGDGKGKDVSRGKVVGLVSMSTVVVVVMA